MVSNHHDPNQCLMVNGHAYEIMSAIIYDGNGNGKEWIRFKNYGEMGILF